MPRQDFGDNFAKLKKSKQSVLSRRLLQNTRERQIQLRDSYTNELQTVQIPEFTLGYNLTSAGSTPRYIERLTSLLFRGSTDITRVNASRVEALNLLNDLTEEAAKLTSSKHIRIQREELIKGALDLLAQKEGGNGIFSKLKANYTFQDVRVRLFPGLDPELLANSINHPVSVTDAWDAHTPVLASYTERPNSLGHIELIMRIAADWGEGGAADFDGDFVLLTLAKRKGGDVEAGLGFMKPPGLRRAGYVDFTRSKETDSPLHLKNKQYLGVYNSALYNEDKQLNYMDGVYYTKIDSTIAQLAKLKEIRESYAEVTRDNTGQVVNRLSKEALKAQIATASPAIAGTSQVGLLTNKQVFYEIFREIDKLVTQGKTGEEFKGNLNELNQLIREGVNPGDERFQRLELGALKVAKRGAAQIADSFDLRDFNLDLDKQVKYYIQLKTIGALKDVGDIRQAINLVMGEDGNPTDFIRNLQQAYGNIAQGKVIGDGPIFVHSKGNVAEGFTGYNTLGRYVKNLEKRRKGAVDFSQEEFSPQSNAKKLQDLGILKAYDVNWEGREVHPTLQVPAKTKVFGLESIVGTTGADGRKLDLSSSAGYSDVGAVRGGIFFMDPQIRNTTIPGIVKEGEVSLNHLKVMGPDGLPLPQYAGHELAPDFNVVRVFSPEQLMEAALEDRHLLDFRYTLSGKTRSGTVGDVFDRADKGGKRIENDFDPRHVIQNEHFRRGRLAGALLAGGYGKIITGSDEQKLNQASSFIKSRAEEVVNARKVVMAAEKAYNRSKTDANKAALQQARSNLDVVSQDYKKFMAKVQISVGTNSVKSRILNRMNQAVSTYGTASVLRWNGDNFIPGHKEISYGQQNKYNIILGHETNNHDLLAGIAVGSYFHLTGQMVVNHPGDVTRGLKYGDTAIGQSFTVIGANEYGLPLTGAGPDAAVKRTQVMGSQVIQSSQANVQVGFFSYNVVQQVADRYGISYEEAAEKLGTGINPAKAHDVQLIGSPALKEVFNPIYRDVPVDGIPTESDIIKYGLKKRLVESNGRTVTQWYIPKDKAHIHRPFGKIVSSMGGFKLEISHMVESMSTDSGQTVNLLMSAGEFSLAKSEFKDTTQGIYSILKSRQMEGADSKEIVETIARRIITHVNQIKDVQSSGMSNDEQMSALLGLDKKLLQEVGADIENVNVTTFEGDKLSFPIIRASMDVGLVQNPSETETNLGKGGGISLGNDYGNRFYQATVEQFEDWVVHQGGLEGLSEQEISNAKGMIQEAFDKTAGQLLEKEGYGDAATMTRLMRILEGALGFDVDTVGFKAFNTRATDPWQHSRTFIGSQQNSIAAPTSLRDLNTVAQKKMGIAAANAEKFAGPLGEQLKTHLASTSRGIMGSPTAMFGVVGAGAVLWNSRRNKEKRKQRGY